MASRRRTVDRRHYPRFEVVGDLVGTLEILRPLPVADISPGGALIESDQPWPIGSVHWIVVANGTEVGRAQVSVRHVEPGAPGGPAYLIGVEFLSLSPALSSEILRWVALGGDAVTEY